MSERDWRLFLKDIHEAAGRVVAYVGAMSSEEFFQDSKSVDAVMRNLAIIGEAAKKIPADARRTYPFIEWKKMAGLRDIVVHDYFGVGVPGTVYLIHVNSFLHSTRSHPPHLTLCNI